MKELFDGLDDESWAQITQNKFSYFADLGQTEGHSVEEVVRFINEYTNLKSLDSKKADDYTLSRCVARFSDSSMAKLVKRHLDYVKTCDKRTQIKIWEKTIHFYLNKMCDYAIKLDRKVVAIDPREQAQQYPITDINNSQVSDIPSSDQQSSEFIGNHSGFLSFAQN